MAVETRPELVGKRFLCVGGGGGGEEPPESGRWRAGVIRAVSQRDSHSPDLAVRAASRAGGGKGAAAGPRRGACGGHRGRARRDTALRLWRGAAAGVGGPVRVGAPAAGTAGVEPAPPPVVETGARRLSPRRWGGRTRRRRPLRAPGKARLRVLAVRPAPAVAAVGEGEYLAWPARGKISLPLERQGSGLGGGNASVPGERRNCRHVAPTQRV